MSILAQKTNKTLSVQPYSGTALDPHRHHHMIQLNPINLNKETFAFYWNMSFKKGYPRKLY